MLMQNKKSFTKQNTLNKKSQKYFQTKLCS
jgi:hypothetical protein